MISNVGILHETLVTRCASAVVGDKQTAAASAMRLSKRFFSAKRALNEELKLHLSLSKPSSLTERAASELLAAAKQRAKSCDAAAVARELEKATSVIGVALRDERVTLKQEDFARHIAVGKLVTAWRKGAAADRVAALESELTRQMTKPSVAEKPDALSTNQHSSVVSKMMTIRMAEAYGEKLSEQHRDIVASAIRGDAAALRERAAASADRLRAASSACRDLDDVAKKQLTELADKLIAPGLEIDDKFVAQLMASVDVERELDAR